MFRRPVVLSALFVALALLPSAALADGAPAEHVHEPEAAEHGVSPDVARRASSIARQTMSPFCPGRTLADCPSEYATEWRKDIRDMVARGMSADEIQAVLSKRAGGDLSGIPNRDVGYGVPIALGLGAAVLLFFVFKRLRPKKNATQSNATDSKTTDSNARETSADAVSSGTDSARKIEHKTAAREDSLGVDDVRLDAELAKEGDDDD